MAEWPGQNQSGFLLAMINPIIYAIPDLSINRLIEVLSSDDDYGPMIVDKTLIVTRASDIKSIPKNISKAIVVIPVGLEPTEQRRCQVALTEAIAVVAQVRNSSDQLVGKASMDEAGKLLGICLKALLGWTPDPLAYSPLEMVPSPAPEFEAGFGYYPIAFETQYILSGANQ